MNQSALIESLNSFDPAVRRQALADLQAQTAPAALMTPRHVNLHCHTFFSYNGYDASPSRVAWEAVRKGWYAVGICDFDVLDGLAEFVAATDQLGVRGTVNLETRVFFSEFAKHEINSPGEPGVYYFMGAGFVAPPGTGSPAAAQLAALRQGAERRNRQMLGRINTFLGHLRLDYEQDILPLTPNGNATERHLCAALYNAGQTRIADDRERLTFWSEKLTTPPDKMAELLQDPMAFSDVIRSKLMKQGGPGYMQPDADTFPALDDVIQMVLDCGAVPMATWLDGTSSGEADINEFLECQIAKGVAALNIIPDRNWNLKDPETARLKITKLHECVAAAERLGLPVNVGTELNKYGQKWVDDFTAAAMQPVTAGFIRGAEIMVGHTRLRRFANFSYAGPQAAAEFPDIAERNAFFAAIGALPAPSPEVLTKLRNGTGETNYGRLADAGKRGKW